MATNQYTIQQGNTLGGLAQQFGTTVAALQALNPQITNPNVIIAGQSLNVPGAGGIPTQNGAPVIDTNVLAANATQPQLPPVTQPQSPQAFTQGLPPLTSPALSGINPAAPGAVSAATGQLGSLETQRSALTKRLAEAQNKLLGKGADQQALEQQLGVSGINQELQSLNEQIVSKKAAFDQAAQDITGRPIGIERQTGKIAQIQRNEAVVLGGLSALYLAKQGKLEGAKAEIDRTLAMKYDPIKQEIENTKTFIDLNYQDLSRAEKKQADALRIQLDREDRAIRNFETKQNMLLKQALDNNASPDTVSKFLNATNKKQLAEASNSLFDNIATNVGVDPKVLGTSDYKTIQGLAPAIKAVNDYKAAVAKWGTFEKLSAKGSGELKSAYGDAISAWKTLAQLGALSGADFGLAENVIPAPSLFTRNKKTLTQLDGTLNRAGVNIGNLAKNLKLAYPGSSSGIDAIVNTSLNPDGAQNDPLNLGLVFDGGSLNPLGI